MLIMVMGVAVFFGLILGVMSSLVTNLMMQMSTFMHKIDIIQLHLVSAGHLLVIFGRR